MANSAANVAAHGSVATDDELPQRCVEAFAHVGQAVRAALRLQHVHAVHIPGRAVYGTGIDTRRPVTP